MKQSVKIGEQEIVVAGVYKLIFFLNLKKKEETTYVVYG